MKPIYDPNRPIYQQIMENIKEQLVRGTLLPGDKIAPVRELALEYGVNPNTMQKALSEMERLGYLRSERTSGRCVTADVSVLELLKKEEMDAVIQRFVEQMEAFGVNRETLPQQLSEYLIKYGEEIK